MPAAEPVEDEIEANSSHEVAVHWHLGERCRSEGPLFHRFRLEFPGGRAEVEVDARLTVTARKASDDPPGGWVSRGYHRRNPGTTIVPRGLITGTTVLVTRIRLLAPDRDA